MDPLPLALPLLLILALLPQVQLSFGISERDSNRVRILRLLFFLPMEDKLGRAVAVAVAGVGGETGAELAGCNSTLEVSFKDDDVVEVESAVERHLLSVCVESMELVSEDGPTLLLLKELLLPLILILMVLLFLASSTSCFAAGLLDPL